MTEIWQFTFHGHSQPETLVVTDKMQANILAHFPVLYNLRHAYGVKYAEDKYDVSLLAGPYVNMYRGISRLFADSSGWYNLEKNEFDMNAFEADLAKKGSLLSTTIRLFVILGNDKGPVMNVLYANYIKVPWGKKN